MNETTLAGQTGSEADRIAFLLRRDGYEATRAWVERTLEIYRTAVAASAGPAGDPGYRRRFERAIGDFESWLASARP